MKTSQHLMHVMILHIFYPKWKVSHTEYTHYFIYLRFLNMIFLRGSN